VAAVLKAEIREVAAWTVFAAFVVLVWRLRRALEPR
jgi:hypothetical protein